MGECDVTYGSYISRNAITFNAVASGKLMQIGDRFRAVPYNFIELLQAMVDIEPTPKRLEPLFDCVNLRSS
ncbi:uncharacterized protein PHALS_02980 [Plasmopara halstedii]|uniref:Uncharacterized protein n=1 Tax=Plasmopara halstedii TaxID=4781 RepID=A0A0P1A739_PLAHL|nr:uncharacterized protein PHALS_02980 [Plasmopara halstedii]CEG36433.1 hypothetical protein PHALS_02980 [Plasmopara halstedii]|eukprot:XP_024572802.1 hypothetical protein PHALS_02980 [Plasmopara halstedii]